MCSVCGCGGSGSHAAHAHSHQHDGKHDHDHEQGHDPRQPSRPIEAEEAFPSAASGRRRIRLAHDLLAENDRHAARNRQRLAGHGIFAVNLLAGPGAGKTTLLERTIADLAPRLSIAVIEGDQETRFDADRIRTAGSRAVQINTHHVCHLDAHMVGHALTDLAPADDSVLFIENIGNLVCPAAFDLGEQAKVVLLSVTEGDDKPLKYPDMFAAATLVLLTKTDLLPYVPFDVGRAQAAARTVNPGLEILEVSALTGAGLDRWYEWICRRRHRAKMPLVPAGAAQAGS
jgi:hydrogenase nickel incorporation protein HypB